MLRRVLRCDPVQLVQVSYLFPSTTCRVAALRATYTSCGTTAANGQSPTLIVYIRSITNVPFDALTLNDSTSGDIEFGSTAPITLEMPALVIQRHGAAFRQKKRSSLVVGTYFTLTRPDPAGLLEQ